MYKTLSTLLLILFTCLLSHGQQHRHVNFFPNRSGWLGGDAFFSVPYKNNKTLWFFGDSFISLNPANRDNRVDSFFINNSVGISDNSSTGPTNFKYHWATKNGEPSSLFPHPKGDVEHRFYWPKSAFWNGDILYLALLDVSIHNPQHSLDFKSHGVVLAQISNPLDAPTQWQFKYLEVPSPAGLYPGSAFIDINDGYIYSFSTMVGENIEVKTVSAIAHLLRTNENHLSDDQRDDLATWIHVNTGPQSPYRGRPMYLQRIHKAKLNRGQVQIETLGQREGQWLGTFQAKHARILFEPGSDEMSVSYNSNTQTFTAVYSLPLVSNHVMVRTSQSLFEGWGEPISFEPYVPLYQNNPLMEGNLTYYAAKHHPHLSSDGKMFFTYVTNSLTPELVMEFPDLYRPIYFYKEWAY